MANEKLSKGLLAELWNISNNMPVDAGDLQSHQGAQELIDLGLAMRYEGKYVLTEKGKAEVLRIKMEGARMLADQSAVNRWAKKND